MHFRLKEHNNDYDDDGYGDNPMGDLVMIVYMAVQAGNSTIDLLGCLDTDGDGYSDQMTNLSMIQPKYLIEMAMAMVIIKVAFW